MTRSLTALVVLLTLTACGASPVALGGARTGAGLAARALDEPAVIKAAAEAARAAIADADAAYAALKLNTAAGRKLTEKREPIVREGLRPVVARLDAATAAIDAKLAADGSARLATLHAQFAQRQPTPGLADDAPDATATALLYRVAQYRLKLSFLVEYAMRRGLIALPAGPDAPTPGSHEEPGDGGVEARG